MARPTNILGVLAVTCTEVTDLEAFDVWVNEWTDDTASQCTG